MGTVYKETFTKPLPAGARIIVRKGRRLAEWKDAKGKTRTAPLTAAGDRIAVEAGTYTAKYRDGSGIVRKVATRCRDESAARSVLTDLEKRAERVRGGLLTADEAGAIDHQERPFGEHIDAYLTKLEAEGTSPDHRANVRRNLQRLAADCQFKRLGSLSREALERWLVAQEKAGMGPRTRNTYRAAAVAFCNWCMETGRLLTSPFAKVAKAAEDSDPRRQRRALTEGELRRLLDVARRRPLEDRSTVYKGPRKGQRYANLRPEVQRRLDRLGQERALIYKTLVLTGLRRGELASITVGQLDLDADPHFLVLDAADEKNREGSTLPLRADLAADLRVWLADKAKAAQDAARDVPAVAFEERHQDEAGGPGGHVLRLPAAGRTPSEGWSLPPDAPLFDVPDKLVRILNRDLKAAGISKRDERGWTVDVHALRHTFGTLLSKGGVAPRTAQAAMRHSKVDLTMNVYTDPKLLDVAGAMESLPAPPLGTGPQREAAAVSATGTDDLPPSPLVPTLVPTTGKSCILGSIRDKLTSNGGEGEKAGAVAVSACPVKRNNPLTSAVNGLLGVGGRGLEPPTPSLSIWRSEHATT